MRFTILIPSRLASTRLPDKPLADIAGLPMVVRVARAVTARNADDGAMRVVVACDSERIRVACAAHGVEAVLTRPDHISGSDRLAEACDILALADDHMVVNVQGDEPLMEPALPHAVATALQAHPGASMGTAAHPIDSLDDYLSPHVVKVVLDAQQHALYFSRAPIPCARDRQDAAWWEQHTGAAAGQLPAPLRHIGIYAYRAGFLRLFPHLAQAPLERLEALEQLRVLWHGHRIVVHVTTQNPGPGIDTPQDLERVRQLLRH